MDYRQKIFDMLGICPYEVFLLNNNLKYRLNNDLYLERFDTDNQMWVRSTTRISEILCGLQTIRKIPQLSTEDRTVVEYLKLCGFNYVAKDSDGTIKAFEYRPIKQRLETANKEIYFSFWTASTGKSMKVYADLSILSTDYDQPCDIRIL